MPTDFLACVDCVTARLASVQALPIAYQSGALKPKAPEPETLSPYAVD